jgi:peptidyl-prolyl cis-trans isomerase C
MIKINKIFPEWKNKLFLFLLLFPLVLIGFTAAVASGKPVAEVNGKVLTEADVEEALNEIMPAARFHRGFSSEKRLSYRPKAIENMIENELLCQEAVKQELKIEKELIETDRNKIIERLGSKKKYKEALKKAGITYEQHTAKLQKKYLVERILILEVEKRSEVSDQEVESYYEKNRKRYMRPEARRIKHILIKVKPAATAEERKLKRERAEEVINKIKAGGDMSVIAWDYSEGPYRVKGGDLGLVHKGRLEPEIEKEAFQLEPGQLSGIIETRYGYHIVKVEEIRAPEQLALEDVAEKIKNMLSEKKEKQLRKALIERLRAQARIEIY